MHFTGTAENGRPVLGGLFKAHDTDGLPLSLSLTFIEKEGMVPDLFGFVLDAAIAGWNDKTIFSRVREAVIDVYGPAHWSEVEHRLRLQFDHFNI